MNAIISLEVPEYQIGQEVSCYFKDTMNVKGICEKDCIRKNIKALGEEMRITQKSIINKEVLIGFNMAVALCNKHIGSLSGEI